MWHVGIDVGGTFTDLFAFDSQTQHTKTSKVLTTQQDRSIGVLDAIAAAQIACDEIETLVHGTTTATNSLVERSYPPVAMITTEGFRDVIEIGRQRRKDLFDLHQQRPKPIVPRRLRFTLQCRLSSKGAEIEPFDDATAVAVAARIKAQGIASVAICFINAYVDSRHEERMREILLKEYPDCHVALSSETARKFREHGRFSTTVIRAALLPVMAVYFDRLRDGLEAKGFTGSLLSLKSNGGMMGADLAKERPEELVESGPAGGVAYARYLSRTTDFSNIIHTDMGGTTFDASIVENGEGLITHEYEIEWEMPITTPMLDIRSVGAGGGSIAWVDEGGSLRVGPQSAGSEPGPACYQRGGGQATVTDANLILGRLDATLGGKLELDAGAAERAVAAVGEEIGLSAVEAAEAIISISCENMAQAIKLVLTDRGRDPRDFLLASFGGAGPMHACFIAAAMNIPQVIVPIHAGVASAFGAISMELRHDLERFYYSPVASAEFARVNEIYAELETQGTELLARDGVQVAHMNLARNAQMRYVGQFWEVLTPIIGGTLNASQVEAITAAFHDQHEAEHGVSSRTFPVEFVSVGLTASGKFKDYPAVGIAKAQNDGAGVERRQVYFSGQWLDTPIYSGERLVSGFAFDGPAIVDYPHSETVLPPATRASVTEQGNLVISIH